MKRGRKLTKKEVTIKVNHTDNIYRVYVYQKNEDITIFLKKAKK